MIRTWRQRRSGAATRRTGTGSIGRERRATEWCPPLPATVQLPTGRAKTAVSWPGWQTAVVLLALLIGTAVAVHAAFDSNVEAVQRELMERGYEPGTIDGAIGSRTRSALRKFQRSVGLPDTGHIDEATLAALGLHAAEHKQEPPASTDTTQTEATPAEAGTATDTDTTQTAAGTATNAQATQTEAGTATNTDTTPAEATPAEAGTGTAAAHAEPLRHKTAARLDFTTLGWHPPQTGAEALARFDEIGAPPEFKRGKGTLFVPKGEFVFVLQAGERFPGLECDPGVGQLTIEFVFGPDGPVIFTPTPGSNYCQAGIGIAIEVGRTLEIRRLDWGDMQLPQGTVRVTAQGLQYID